MADPPGGLAAALADRYTIDRELGHGGMASVYLAQDHKHKRRVAIKVLAPELALTVRTERFLREIQIAAQLAHPHILPVHDSGAAGGFLYYVMPHVEGESLHERLAREGPLPLAEALRITRDVASALSYAHARGVVHRDIKPANILFSAGEAVVADFGIARAIAAESESLTATGLSVGTPAYMSPEQAGGSGDVDGRSDIYSLGCVLYEMLAGAPPFTGPSAQALLAKHLVDPAPSLRSVRRDVPESVERVIEKALAKTRDERFATASELAEALAPERLDAVTPTVAEPVRPRRRLSYRAAMIPLGLILAVVTVRAMWRDRSAPSGGDAALAAGPALDTLRYVILPFEYDKSVAAALNAQHLIQDGLTRWSGITVVDPFQVRDALARRDSGTLSTRDAQRVAIELGAGRYVRGEVSHLGDSLRVHAALYDATGSGSVVSEGTVKLGADLAHADSMFGALADRLLFGTAGAERLLEAQPGTRSFSAHQAYARGLAAVEQWNLAAADSAFRAATEYDLQYAQAFLWLAQVRSWSGRPTATWRSAAERAAARRTRLSSRDQVLSDALLAHGRGEVERACATWGRLAARMPYDFTAWYGWGNCLARDSAVVADPASPSKWRFRSSYHQALKAYQEAFRLLPTIHNSLRRHSYESVRRLLMTEGQIRLGRALSPDTAVFVAHPSWQGDSLAFIPFTAREVGEARVRRQEGYLLAVRRQRELFHEIATAWAAAFPQSADAMEALALSLEMLGDPFCLDTLRRARTLARHPDQRARLAGSEAWVQLKFSIPADPPRLRAARALADSLLRAHPPMRAREPGVLASLAAVTGRAHLAASLYRLPAATDWNVPGPIATDAPALLAFAALGGPGDSLRALELRVEAGIDRLAGPEQQPNRLEWLARPATLAFPDHRLGSITKLAGTGSARVDAQTAFLRGDTAAVRAIFANWRAARQASRPADLTLDALYPEAWLLAELGDDRGAIDWLDPTLSALSATAPHVFTDPARAGALVRAMALRADLAERIGDRATARRWATAVLILWSNADEFLQPVVRRMKRLAG